MKRILFAALGGVALVAAAPNWVAMVTPSAIGGHVMGNPKAKVKLIEYLSYTCGHCAHFSADSSVPLKKAYVASGNVSVEFRNAVLNQLDFTAALAARCGGAGKFFGNTELLLAQQRVWAPKGQAYVQANIEKLKTQSPQVALPQLARAMGLDALLKPRGITPAQLDVCMKDKAAQQKIVAMTNDALETRKIEGTPSFVINGQLQASTSDWSTLEPKIKAALAAK